MIFIGDNNSTNINSNADKLESSEQQIISILDDILQKEEMAETNFMEVDFIIDDVSSENAGEQVYTDSVQDNTSISVERNSKEIEENEATKTSNETNDSDSNIIESNVEYFDNMDSLDVKQPIDDPTKELFLISGQQEPGDAIVNQTDITEYEASYNVDRKSELNEEESIEGGTTNAQNELKDLQNLDHRKWVRTEDKKAAEEKIMLTECSYENAQLYDVDDSTKGDFESKGKSGTLVSNYLFYPRPVPPTSPPPILQ